MTFRGGAGNIGHHGRSVIRSIGAVVSLLVCLSRVSRGACFLGMPKYCIGGWKLLLFGGFSSASQSCLFWRSQFPRWWKHVRTKGLECDYSLLVCVRAVVLPHTHRTSLAFFM